MNDSLRHIAEKLYEADNILLFPHVGIDADAAGSCAALAKALRKLGKSCSAVYDDGMPEYLDKMFGEYFTYIGTETSEKLTKPDISMLIDCGGMDRIEGREYIYESAPFNICIDHHITSSGICNLNHIDAKAAAAGELIYELVSELNILSGGGIVPDQEIGEAIFAAITTDTGNFQYSNTTGRSHAITAELYGWGIDTNKVSVEIYENERPEKIMAVNRAMSRLRMISGGRAAVCWITAADIEEFGIRAGETDSIVQTLRSIAGVEYAAFLKEKEENVIRVSLRAKREGDVRCIAERFDGGGHIKAAGCTLETGIDEAVAAITAELEKACEKLG